MKVTQKVHGELTAARKAKRAAKAVAGKAAAQATGDASAESTSEVAEGVGHAEAIEAKRKGRKKQVPATGPAPESTTTHGDEDELVVFAFRLTRAERDAIHAAAGPARASKFVKGLAVAAAQGDVDGIGAILTEAKARRDG